MCEMDLKKVDALLHKADTIIIAASNGFDIADGYNQFACDEEFLRIFGDYYHTYHLRSIIQGLMARWPTDTERWHFLKRLIAYGYKDYRPSPTMRALKEIIAQKPYFIITCNCNGHFERSGFSAQALFETEGSFSRLACSRKCSSQTYGALDYLDSSEPPRCSQCGAPLDAAVDEINATSLEPYCTQETNLNRFFATHHDESVVILELGVGQYNVAIKRPLMKWAQMAPGVNYVVINKDEPILPTLPADRIGAVRDDIGATLHKLAGEMR